MRILLFVMLVFACLNAVSAQAQTLQAGDSIYISVYQDPKLDRQVLIGPTGMISFSLVGQIRAAGLTPAAREGITKERRKGKFTEPPDVSVAFAATKVLEEELKPRVYITGEVLRPGYFFMRTKLDVMQAIAEAGGFSTFVIE